MDRSTTKHQTSRYYRLVNIILGFSFDTRIVWIKLRYPQINERGFTSEKVSCMLD